MAVDNYNKGRKAEELVAAQLRRAGASVKVSPGSRGAADLTAKFNNKEWLVQVKSGQNPPSQLNGVDKQRLNQRATKNNATPVLATVSNGKIEYRSTRNNRTLNPKK